MKIKYNFDSSFAGANHGIDPATGQRTAQQLGGRMTPINVVLSVNIGDFKFEVAPRVKTDNAGNIIDNEIEVPSKILRHENLPQQLEVLVGGYGPHQDYVFVRQSGMLVYQTRAVVGTGVVVKQMAAGARPGDTGLMTLYKGITDVADVETGAWTQRLTREFVVTAADIATRESGWPQSGSAPTIAGKKVVDGGGDGYLHI